MSFVMDIKMPVIWTESKQQRRFLNLIQMQLSLGEPASCGELQKICFDAGAKFVLIKTIFYRVNRANNRKIYF